MRLPIFSLAPVIAVTLLLVFASTTHASTSASSGSPSLHLALGLLRTLLLAALVFASVASLKIPGTGIAEAVTLTVLAALVVPTIVTGTGQWYEVLALITGVALIAIEVFVLPGFGATGAAGLLLVFVSFVFLLLPDVRLPGAVTVDNVRNALLVFLGGTTGGVAAVGLLGHLLPRVPRASRLILNETNAGPMPEPSGPAVGDSAVAVTDLRPGGTARVALNDNGTGCRDVNVVCDRGFIAAGTKLVIVDVEGTQVLVRPVKS